jgi:hypothetical protein
VEMPAINQGSTVISILTKTSTGKYINVTRLSRVMKKRFNMIININT